MKLEMFFFIKHIPTLHYIRKNKEKVQVFFFVSDLISIFILRVEIFFKIIYKWKQTFGNCNQIELNILLAKGTKKKHCLQYNVQKTFEIKENRCKSL